MCRQAGLYMDDLENMTIGMCIDYSEEYADVLNPNKKPKARKASQLDFDKF